MAHFLNDHGHASAALQSGEVERSWIAGNRVGHFSGAFSCLVIGVVLDHYNGGG